MTQKEIEKTMEMRDTCEKLWNYIDEIICHILSPVPIHDSERDQWGRYVDPQNNDASIDIVKLRNDIGVLENILDKMLSSEEEIEI